MKFEWRKQEKNLYLPKEKPELLTVPKQKFITIQGKGDPNSPQFSELVGVLYSVAYAIKMIPKHGFTPEGYYDYTVYPLEGLWDLTEEGRLSSELIKEELLYTLMIRQPDFVTNETFDKAIERVRKKYNHSRLSDVAFEVIEDGLSVQMLHIGAYDDEPKTFEQMKKFILENNLQITSLRHREIYLSDARKTAQEKLKTVLRYQVSMIE